MREDVARAHAELPAVCEHIHLPLQSGSSRILKAMRRTYDRERYLRRVEMLREHVPDVALTTDIIVAFPGETEDDFRETLEVAEEVGYDGAFTFIYSPRRDTEAADLPGRIPHEVAVERMERLVEVVQRRARQRAQRFVGRTLDVLVEGPSRTDPSRLRGRTRHNKVVNFTGVARAGEIVPVRISSATSQTLAGDASLMASAGSGLTRRASRNLDGRSIVRNGALTNTPLLGARQVGKTPAPRRTLIRSPRRVGKAARGWGRLSSLTVHPRRMRTYVRCAGTIS